MFHQHYDSGQQKKAVLAQQKQLCDPVLELTGWYNQRTSLAISHYTALGVASTEYGNKATDDDAEGAISAGIGARYYFNDRGVLRGAARYSRRVCDQYGAYAYM